MYEATAQGHLNMGEFQPLNASPETYRKKKVLRCLKQQHYYISQLKLT